MPANPYPQWGSVGSSAPTYAPQQPNYVPPTPSGGNPGLSVQGAPTFAPQYGAQAGKVPGAGQASVGAWSSYDPYAPHQSQRGTLSGPGVGESYWNDVADFFKAPTAAGEFWEANAGKFNQPQHGPNQAQQGYQRFMNGSADANLDPYYEAAWGHAANDVNKSYGARGMFNSSEALKGLERTRGDLAAQQAREEADFAFKRGQEERQWATAASGEQGDAQNRDLARMMAGGQFAGQADTQELNRVLGGAHASQIAQGLEEGRIRGGYQDLMAQITAGFPSLSGGYSDAIGGDKDLFMDIISLMLGIPREKFNQSNNEGERAVGAVGTGAQVAALL